MSFLSSSFRFIHRKFYNAANFFRIIKLRWLFPGLSIDFSSVVEENCRIKCIEGGRLIIRKSTISAGTQLVADAGGTLSISNAFIGRNCVITAKQKVEIRSGCLIAEMVVLRDQDHLVDLHETTDNRAQFSIAPIVIEENVWLAAKATILKGVTVGKGSVVAASSVITGNVPEGEVWGGIPGKFLKKVNVQQADNFLK